MNTKDIIKAQEDYILAKANLDALRELEEEIEQEYIRANGIVNPDGSVPIRIFCINDDRLMERASDEIEEKVSALGLNQAEDIFIQSEDALIECGLSLVPADIRMILTESVKREYCIRQKLIKTVLCLDVSTIPV